MDEEKPSSNQLRRLPVELAVPSGAALFFSFLTFDRIMELLAGISLLEGLTGGRVLR